MLQYPPGLVGASRTQYPLKVASPNHILSKVGPEVGDLMLCIWALTPAANLSSSLLDLKMATGT